MSSRGTAIRVGSCLVVAICLTGYAIFGLAPSLPHRYAAQHWRTAWVGLDLAMAACAVATAWLEARDSPFVVIAATAVAVLLVGDAWFDCLTANAHDLPLSLASLAVEIPTASFFGWLAVSRSRRT